MLSEKSFLTENSRRTMASISAIQFLNGLFRENNQITLDLHPTTPAHFILGRSVRD